MSMFNIQFLKVYVDLCIWCNSWNYIRKVNMWLGNVVTMLAKYASTYGSFIVLNLADVP